MEFLLGLEYSKQMTDPGWRLPERLAGHDPYLARRAGTGLGPGGQDDVPGSVAIKVIEHEDFCTEPPPWIRAVDTDSESPRYVVGRYGFRQVIASSQKESSSCEPKHSAPVREATTAGAEKNVRSAVAVEILAARERQRH